MLAARDGSGRMARAWIVEKLGETRDRDTSG
jgi:hypothetical protein